MVVQTPQAFRSDLLEAQMTVQKKVVLGTDEASL